MRRIGQRTRRPGARGWARRVRAAMVLVVCASLVVTACGRSGDEDERPFDPTATEAPSPELQKYYSQRLDWKKCEDRNLQCAWLTVPMDYADPGGETIEIAVARKRADDSVGSVVFNPGGPGSSGVDYVSTVVGQAGAKLRKNLDVVGFDPRGVQRSAPITCLSDADLDRFFSTDIDASTPSGLTTAQTAADRFAQACLDNTGPLLAHVDTVSAARDMDVLRAALRETTLTYLGFSYGTQLGATYAELFPDRVGRMVLDGAKDPTLSPSQWSVVQAGGFESALRAYAADCLKARDCPLSGTVDDAVGQVADVLDEARAHPMRTDGRRALTGTLAFYGVAVALYSQGNWSHLTKGLRTAIGNGDGTYLLWLSDRYLDRDGDGVYTANSIVAFLAIGCVDARGDADPAAMAAEAAELKTASPTFWRYFAYGAVGCANWPVPLPEPLTSYTAEGAPPIVVVGTTNDPATPYAQAQSLAAMLDSGVLVTYKGEGHTAYLTAGDCIQDAVDDFLVDGTVPEDGLTCE
ncbi:MAG: alpha/beta hydrolase [Micrococcales bacterium]|nr:alpha/beta hydrolase [Micrococcales bacterium]